MQRYFCGIKTAYALVEITRFCLNLLDDLFVNYSRVLPFAFFHIIIFTVVLNHTRSSFCEVES
jgi:hypothetical protein